MKQLPPGLEAALATGVTTLCWCWRVARTDGVVLGFTDHDRDLTFAGTTFLARSGFTATEITDAVGLGVDSLDVDAALSSDAIDEDDLASGRWDGARVEIWRVDWQDTQQRVLMRTGSIGEVTRRGTSFTAEIRGLADALQQPAGHLFQYTCDADLGDARCGVDLGRPDLTGSGVVASVLAARTLTVDGLETFAAGLFARGRLTIASGPGAGLSFEIKQHRVVDGLCELELWQAPVHTPQPGTSVTVSAGCDRRFATCRDRFANAVNFRGFPHMPGNDFVTSFASRRTS